MNSCNMVGNVGKVLGTTEDRQGGKIFKFTLAVKRARAAREGQPDTDWFFVTCFGQQAETAEQYLYVGRSVSVEGRIELTRRDHKTFVNEDGSAYQVTYVDYNANRVGFIGKYDPPADHAGPAASNGQARQAQPAAAAPAAAADDDMPF